MTTKVEKSIEVDAPVSTVYNQWTQFEEFPQFMGGVKEIQQLDDRRLHWVAEIAGVKREWDAEILEQVPDQKIAWAATSGATNAGAVYFASLGAGRTTVRLSLEYAPEGIVESVGDKLGFVEKQAQSDLERFKKFIESRGSETGGWRGDIEGNMVGTPGVEEAAMSEGDSGKAGMSGKAKLAGAAAVVAGVAATRAMKGGDKEDETYEAPAMETDTTYETPVMGTTFDTPASAYATSDIESGTYATGVEDASTLRPVDSDLDADVYPTDMVDEEMGTSTTERDRSI